MNRSILAIGIILLFIGIAFTPDINAYKNFLNPDSGNVCLDDSDLVYWGELNWTNVKPSETVYGKFTIRNAGKIDTLYWEISEWPEWGIWDFGSFFPKLPPGGHWIVFVNMTAPNQGNETFTGHVKVVNKNNASDFGIINASLTTSTIIGYNIRISEKKQNIHEYTFDRHLFPEFYDGNNADEILDYFKQPNYDKSTNYGSDELIIEIPTELVQSLKGQMDSVTIDKTTSYHKEISGQKFWLAIKATFSEPTNFTMEYIHIDDSNNSKTNFNCDLYHKENCYIYRLERWCWGSDIDKYFQIHLGPLNWSYYHEDSEIQWWGKSVSKWVFSNLTGSCYFTFIRYATDNLFNIWINATKNATFSTTNGTDVFKFERHDFFGTINIGSKKITFMLNGKKDIQIENSLFAWFETGLNNRNGFELFKYWLPTGEYKQRFQVDRQGVSKVINESEDFKKALWWGPNGKWTFKATMLNRGYYPNIHLFGADIRLPD